MHAAINALPMPATGPSLVGKWIRAYALVAITVTLVALASNALQKMMEPNFSFIEMAWFKALLGFVVLGVNFAVYAELTGPVLREKLPGFSRREWIAAHLAIAAFFAFIAGVDQFDPASAEAASTVAPQGQIDWSLSLLLVLVVGPILGAVIGGLQALVLRPAARGALYWTAGFAIAGSAIALVGTLSPLVKPMHWNSYITPVVHMGIVNFVAIMLVALITFLAFKRLTPKG